MSKLVFVILTTLSLNVSAQEWKDYQVDSNFTINLPENAEKTDTLGQTIITSQMETGMILITVIENQGPSAMTIQDEKELTGAYQGFQEGAINSQQGTLVKSEITDIKGLKALKFSFKVSTEGEKQLRHCLVLFVNNKIYAVNFWELEALSDQTVAVREKLFSSIKLPASATSKNQLTNSNDSSDSYDLGYIVGQFLGFGLVIGLAIFLFIRYSKKNNKSNATEKDK